MYKSVQERSAVITERRARVGVNFKFMGRFWVLQQQKEQLYIVNLQLAETLKAIRESALITLRE